MKLSELLTTALRAPLPPHCQDSEVIAISPDSRAIAPGSLFVAVRGFHSDGHQFISQALAQGAVAVIAEQGRAQAAGSVPLIPVPDSRRALALLADAFYGHPSGRLKLAGITGTNGKTTTSYLVKSIIEAGGGIAGLIGTIDYRVGGRVYPAPNTTPEPSELQRFLAEMIGQNAKYCVMEVSSHALALNRTLGCEFAVAGFTNLTQDHLDFHQTMDAYFAAKRALFTGLSPDSVAVINLDDGRAGELMAATNAKIITTGMAMSAGVHPVGSIGHGINGLSFSAATPAGAVAVESPLVGRHNIYNILTALGIGTALGFSAAQMAQGISRMKAVPGRMEKVDAGQPFGVIVDYAHTEDALLRLLEAIREIARKRIITVFGCGGDRDRTKRPKMGAVAVQGSDLVIITSDNPRSEDPLGIIREIEAGMQAKGQKPYQVIPDRHQAIHAAIAAAEPGDMVVLAGKGHEDYQVIGNTKHHFDDREVAREAIGKSNAIADCGFRIEG